MASGYAEQNDGNEARSKENDKGIMGEAADIPYDSIEHLTYKPTGISPLIPSATA